MKAVCLIQLGLYKQSVVYMNNENGVIKIEQVPHKQLSKFFASDKEISEIELFGPKDFIQKIQKETKEYDKSKRNLKFILH